LEKGDVLKPALVAVAVKKVFRDWVCSSYRMTAIPLEFVVTVAEPR
jgi:hypothetical protein